MPKKKGEYSVLSEVNTEDEWLQLCKKEARENPKMKDFCCSNRMFLACI